MRQRGSESLTTSRDVGNPTGAILTTGDVNVGLATTTAVTYEWWSNLLTFIPQLGQNLILLFTVIYVIFRAANEVLRFIKNRKGQAS